MNENKDLEKISTIKLSKKLKIIILSVFSILVICTIGFFVVLGILVSKNDKVNIKGENVKNQKEETQNKDDKNNEIIVAEISDKDIVIGNKNAHIIWYLYDDLECPFCKKFHPTVEKLFNEYKGKIRIVFRHFPLFSIHPTTLQKARAIECMKEIRGNQDAFNLVGKIYEKADMYGKLDIEEVYKLASEIGVNKSKFKQCVSSNKYDSYIKQAYQAAIKAGAQGTPYSILENKAGIKYQIPGAYPYEYVKQVIEELLK